MSVFEQFTSQMEGIIHSFCLILDDPDNALRQAVAETWESKAFADVEIVCGVDGGTLLSHRIVLVIIHCIVFGKQKSFCVKINMISIENEGEIR